jgi:hypothetical protein
MKTLTEKVEGRREWSLYGLHELKKTNSDFLSSILISNALGECGLKPSPYNSRMFWLSKKLFIRVTSNEVILGLDSQGVDDDEIILERIVDPHTLFDRIRVVWDNHHCE